MLSTTRLVAIVPVRDLDRARNFYEQTLGLSPGDAPDPEGVLFSDDGHTGLQLLLRPDAPVSELTQASFEVPDVEAAVRELEGRGVRFEDYDLPGLRTVDHVATAEGMRAAWFTDSEGNILCLHQRTG
ncbi:VOC family protein [Kocuria turfanensis]|uniref:Glyoxalase n=1 Tax=Kocuria turfanensis TaxID=388357 RepID=A0A512IBC6_9MICC|nr:VOC family protein [Kocuria turfanensis]GEO95000.1 glyoxalase [Kocuria turfanensis]